MKKFKRLFILSAVIVLCLSVTLGNVMTAFGAKLDNSEITSTTNDAFTIPKHQTTYDVGETIKFDNLNGATFTAKDPIGRTITPDSDGKFVANMAGYYVVTFVKGNVTYDRLILKVEADKASFKIPFKGADIPTNVAVGSDKLSVEFFVPVPDVVVYDEDDSSKYESVVGTDDYQISYKITSPKGSIVTDRTEVKDDAGAVIGYTYKSQDGKGTYLVRYTAKKGDVVLNSDFRVNAIEDFSDTEAPKFSPMTVSNALPQRVKYTLPVATATDDHDTNVKITVSVTDSNNKKVKAVKDNNGVLELLDTDAVFDNDKQMAFYPWEAGTYTIRYTATDDSGNEKSLTYDVTVSDNRAPVINADSLPSSINWGVNVKKGAETEFSAQWLTIDVPEVTDNVAIAGKDKDGNNIDLVADKDTKAGANEIRLFFSLKKGDTTVFNSRTAAITADHEFARFNKTTNKFELLFNETGAYTLTLTAYDTDSNGAYNNPSSRAIKIDVADEYVDTDKPNIEVKALPQYIFVGEKFVAPVIEVWDMYGAEDDKKESSGVVKTIEYTFVEGSNEEIILKDKSFFTPTKAGEIKIKVTAVDLVGQTEEVTRSIQVFENDIDFTDNGLALKSWNPIAVTADNKAVLTGTEISAGNNANNFLGYELIVKEGNTEIQSKVVSYITADKLVLENIAFDVKLEGTTLAEDYTVTLRAYRINGESVVYGQTYASGTTVTANATEFNIGDVISENKTVGDLEALEGYKLPDADEIEIASNFRVVEGAGYSLHGNVFTPKAIGASYFIDLYQADVENNAYVFESENGKAIKYSLIGSNDSVTSVDTSSVEVGLRADTDNYQAKWTGKTGLDVELNLVQSGFVRLPEVNKYMDKSNAINGNPVVTATVTVTDSKGKSDVQIYRYENNKLVPVSSKSFLTQAGDKYIRPDVDGKYTVNYSFAKGASAKHEVLVGDLVMPTIDNLATLGIKSSYKQGFKLELNSIKATVSDNVSAADKIDVKIKLYAPSGALMSVETDDDGNEFYTLNDSGNYRLVYEVTDEAGNTLPKSFNFSVSAKGNPVNYELLSTVLIIAAIVLIIGGGVYFFRFRKIQE